MSTRSYHIYEQNRPDGVFYRMIVSVSNYHSDSSFILVSMCSNNLTMSVDRSAQDWAQTWLKSSNYQDKGNSVKKSSRISIVIDIRGLWKMNVFVFHIPNFLKVVFTFFRSYLSLTSKVSKV